MTVVKPRRKSVHSFDAPVHSAFVMGANWEKIRALRVKTEVAHRTGVPVYGSNYFE